MPATTKLREWREEHGYSLQEIGDLTGLAPSTLSRAERGVLHLRPDKRVRVARALGARVADLFDPDPIDPQENEAA